MLSDFWGDISEISQTKVHLQRHWIWRDVDSQVTQGNWLGDLPFPGYLIDPCSTIAKHKPGSKAPSANAQNLWRMQISHKQTIKILKTRVNLERLWMKSHSRHVGSVFEARQQDFAIIWRERSIAEPTTFTKSPPAASSRVKDSPGPVTKHGPDGRHAGRQRQ